MTRFTKIVALVPMRHHSQRVPGKNYRSLAGKPLYYYILETLQKCPDVSQIVVDTDSEPVMEGIQKDFREIQIVDRPEALRGDAVSMNEILLYDTQHFSADLYLQTHSTNPLLKTATISRAIKKFEEESPKFDSLFGVTRLNSRLWYQNGKPVNHDPNILLQTQDLPPIYEENSCIYLFTRENLVKRHNRLGAHPLLFEIDRDEAWDIDEELDFVFCDLILSQQKR